MKIAGGNLKNHPLTTSRGTRTRPTSEKLRQTVFDICQNHINNADFLDLFAGSGAMGIEALSRGAGSATFIENNRLALKAINENLNRLNLWSRSKVISKDVVKSLKRLAGQSFDLIYVDPPYEDDLYEDSLHSIDSNLLLRRDGILFVEARVLKKFNLKTLALKKTRKIGSTNLFEFILKS